jgi:hypothetical protein
MKTLNSNNMSQAESLINEINEKNGNVKIIRKERGLMERDNSKEDKVILTEDNRQILFG